MKRKRSGKGLKRKSLRGKKKPIRAKRRRPATDRKLAEKLHKSKSRGDDFFTDKEMSVAETMLATGSVAVTCEKEKISEARYYQIVGNFKKKWGMSWVTQNRANAIYNKAKKLKNPLARHLTEVKRVELLAPSISAPQQVETTTFEEPQMGEETA